MHVCKKATRFNDYRYRWQWRLKKQLGIHMYLLFRFTFTFLSWNSFSSEFHYSKIRTGRLCDDREPNLPVKYTDFVASQQRANTDHWAAFSTRDHWVARYAVLKSRWSVLTAKPLIIVYFDHPNCEKYFCYLKRGCEE